jgi:hypothetical protein
VSQLFTGFVRINKSLPISSTSAALHAAQQAGDNSQKREQRDAERIKRVGSSELCHEILCLGRLMVHADAPDEFLRADDADVRREAFGAPSDRGVAADAAICRGVSWFEVLGVFIGAGRSFEIGQAWAMTQS